MKKNLPLLVGIALPLVFIIVISIVIFTPSLFIKPAHNFIYTIDDNYYNYNLTYKNTYIVENSHIISEATPARTPIQKGEAMTYKGDSPKLYLYDVRKNSSHEITFNEAKDLLIDPGPSSPDGYTIKYEYRNDGIFELFGSSGENSGYFISKNSGNKRLNGLSLDRYYGPGYFKLIGWVK